MPDQELVCDDCRKPFTFTESEQQFYAEKNLAPPRRCPACRDIRKEQRTDRKST
jgi:hypothetical protein